MDGLKSGYRRAIFIWIAMGFSLFIYAFVVEILRMNPAFLHRPSLLPEIENLRFGFLVLAIGQFFLIGFVRKRLVYTIQAQKHPGNGGPISERVSKLINASIVTHALCESVALYGMVLFFLTSNSFDFYVFMVLSLMYLAFYFPRYAQWEESVREFEGERSLGVFARS